MLDELNVAIREYNVKWQKLVNGRNDKVFFDELKPTAVGWKVADRSTYDKLVRELHDCTDKISETWMNGRWIAKLHLKDTKLEGDIEIIKVMQRRPDSKDALGLDHLDFFTPVFDKAEQVLKSEPGLKWSWESNDIKEGYDWLSIWFDSAEAKVKANTVLDIVADELQELSKQLIWKEE